MARQNRAAQLRVEGLERREAPSGFQGAITRPFGGNADAIGLAGGSPVVAINAPNGNPVVAIAQSYVSLDLIQKPGH
jgi:hypothetical protein